MTLTPKREVFALGLARGLSQSAAYREAFPSSHTWADSTIWSKASTLAKDGKVSERVAELLSKAAAANEVTLASHVAELASLRNDAKAAEQYGAAIQAEIARGKASGLYSEKVQISGAGGAPLHLRVSFEKPKDAAS